MKATVLLIQIEGTDADLARVLDLLRAQISGEPPAPPSPPLPDTPTDPAPVYSSSHSAPARKRRGRGPGRRAARRATETPPADEPPPPPPGKAQRLTPGPSTIGIGPPRARDGVARADEEAVRILERHLSNVGDSQRLVEFGDVGVRVAVREAAFEDPRFTVESKGRGVPVVIRRVG